MTNLEPIVVAASAPHTHTVIFLHGRGDTAENFHIVVRSSTDSQQKSLHANFPSIRWVFPVAEVSSLAAAPDEKWSQWFDIWDTRDFSIREELQAEGLKTSVCRIRALLHQEANLLHGNYDRIVLMGISQGAATAIHTLLNLNIRSQVMPNKPVAVKLGALVGFSCRMPFPGRSLAETRRVLGLEDSQQTEEVIRNTPVLLEHCVNDPVVFINDGRTLRDTLERFGAQVVWREYPTGGHWFNSPTGMDDAIAFLRHVLEPGLRLPITMTGSESYDIVMDIS